MSDFLSVGSLKTPSIFNLGSKPGQYPISSSGLPGTILPSASANRRISTPGFRNNSKSAWGAIPGFGSFGSSLGIGTSNFSFGNGFGMNGLNINTMSPRTKKLMIIGLLIVIVVCIFIYNIYKFYKRRWDIRDSLYYYEAFHSGKLTKKIYYGSPLTMDKESLPGGTMGSFWNRTDTSLRILDGNYITIENGATIRMWLRLQPDNFTENLSEPISRTIFTGGLIGSQGTQDQIINNPDLLLSNRNWMDYCHLGLFLDRSVNRLTFQVGKKLGGVQQCHIDDVPIQKWFQLTLRVSSGVVEAYIDGELLNIWSISDGFTIPSGSTITLFNQIPSVGFWGHICFFQSYAKVLTPDEIQHRYNLESSDIRVWNKYNMGHPDTQPTIVSSCDGETCSQ